MAQRSGAVEVAELMPAYPPNWDAISQRQHPRKPCHSSDAQTGTHFPNGMPGGNRTPESRPRTGQTFRLRAVSESASRSGAIFWDELSARGSTGNGIPFWSLIPGHSFRLRAVSESASHSERGFRDTVSAEGRPGKRIPFQARILGHSFRFKQKAPARDGVGAKGAVYAVDGERRRQSAMAVRALLYPR